MKIVCRVKVTAEVMGYESLENIKKDCTAYPHLRPCANRRHGEKLGGWVYKRRCVKCPYCEKVIQEKESPGEATGASAGEKFFTPTKR